MRRTLLAASLLATLLAPLAAFAQAPPAVPALPDSERRTSYSLTASTCACNVNFALFGTGTDVDEWIQVWVNGKQYLSTDASVGWSLSSVTGPLATIARPITDAVLTFNIAQTGTVQIVGAERPRQLTQFTEGRGVAARDLNQRFTDITAIERELWDKTSDLSGRGFFFQPGVTTGPMPQPSQCANDLLGFDASGHNPVCYPPTGVQPVVRSIFTGATNFYVDVSNGVNNATCGLSTGASACQTMTYAYNSRLATSYDLGGQQVTLQLANGTGYAPLSAVGRLVGQTSALIIQGNTGNQDSVVVDGGGSAPNCISETAGAWLQVQYVKVQNCTNLLASFEQHGLGSFQNVDFGSPISAGVGIYVSRQGYMEAIGGGNTISGSGFSNFIQASHQGNFRAATGAQLFQLSTNITLSAGGTFAYATSQGDITFTGYTSSPFNLNSHTVTGQRWSIDSAGLIQNLNALTGGSMTPTFFPGSSAGFCLGDCSVDVGSHASPTVTSCGTSPSVAGNDFYGTVTTGSSATTSCTVSFSANAAFSIAPYCTVTWASSSPPTGIYAISSTSTLGVTYSSQTSGQFTYQCKGS